jgi:DNA repair protein RadC
MRISDIPENLRPREKALQYGIEELSDQELLTLIIGSGTRGNSAFDIATELLRSHANSLELLSRTNYQSLLGFRGLKKSIALRLLATFEFHKRLISGRYQNITKIDSVSEVYFRYKYLENFEQEVLVILMLDLKLRIIKEKILYKGTFDSFTIDVREVIHELVLATAKYFYLIHNHPDEEKEPSEDDILSTKIVEKTALNLGIQLLNHLVIFKGGFSCVKDQ